MDVNDWPPKFTLDARRVLDLFTGDRFYSSADAAIREVILNAIDACGRRRIDESKISQDITVTFDDQEDTVTVSDNGIGMNEEELADLFLRVGASASNVAQQSHEKQFKAIGEFGIGVVSYFLVCDRYQLHTLKTGAKPIALEFSHTMLDAKTPAREISPSRDSIGTTVIFFIKDGSIFQQLLKKFSHWVRAVEGLSARAVPGDTEIKQGGLTREVRVVKVETPDWIENAQLGPPSVFDVWEHLDGKGHVDVLYRGVFVQRVDVNNLWGIEGSIHVDPKHFKPKLNREGFVGEKLEEEVTRFLQTIHPAILRSAIGCVREVLTGEDVRDWTILRWATLWLSVPRSGAYAEVAKAWDEEFRHRKAFRLLEAPDMDREVSVVELQALTGKTIYIAPPRLQQAGMLVQQAVRVLRARGDPVVQGIQREGGYLTYAQSAWQSTSDLLIQRFRDSLPTLVPVDSVAQQVLSEEAIDEIFDEPPKVRIVQLGQQGAPLVRVSDDIWINIESAQGKRIIQEICDRNEGHLGLWIACLKHAPGFANEVATSLKTKPESTAHLGIVRRQQLRDLTR